MNKLKKKKCSTISLFKEKTLRKYIEDLGKDLKGA